MNFVPETPVLLTFLGAALLLALTPGPDMTLFLGRTLAQGRTAGLAVIAGTMTGCLMHTVLVAAGISALLKASPTAFLALKTAGALYLLWLAFQAVRYGSSFNVKVEGRPRSLWREYAKGWAVNALNPKVVLFFVAFFPTFVSANDPDATSKLLFLGVLFTLVPLPLFVLMVFVAEALTATIKLNRRIARAIDYLFATVFAAFAVRILTGER